jgi:tRNA threonylcarbamoyl adenosine modification protein (Sua5/YciO/YrdC/YwlC family)
LIEKPMPQLISDVQFAKELLLKNDIVAIPTETVYGLAADARSSEAIAKIYALKKRPLEKALALNIHPAWPINQWCERVPSYTAALIKQFWPGPLTLVLPLRSATVLPMLEGPHQTIALRCPAHPLTIALLEHLGHPIVAPSANPSHQLSPTSATEVAAFFPNSHLHILDGGPSALGIESTILKLADEHHCEILRYGAISAQQIEDCIGFKPQCPNIPCHPVTRLKNLYYSENGKAPSHLQMVQFPDDLQACQKSFYQILQRTQDGRIHILQMPHPQNPNWLVIHQQIKKFASPICDLEDN